MFDLTFNQGLQLVHHHHINPCCRSIVYPCIGDFRWMTCPSSILSRFGSCSSIAMPSRWRLAQVLPSLKVSNSEFTPENGWLGDKPFLLGRSIFRGFCCWFQGGYLFGIPKRVRSDTNALALMNKNAGSPILDELVEGDQCFPVVHMGFVHRFDTLDVFFHPPTPQKKKPLLPIQNMQSSS